VRIAAICLLLSTATLAANPSFEVEGRAPLCRTILTNLIASNSINRAVQLSGFSAIPFQRTKLSFQTARDSPPLSEDVDVARFDIDNDGQPDVVVKYETWLRQRPGDVLWILPVSANTDMSALPSLTSEEFAKLGAVEPMSPWPYANRGVWLARIAALTREGTTYLSLRDTSFGDKGFPDRRWLLAKYQGHGIASRGFHQETDSLETVCAFRYAEK